MTQTDIERDMGRLLALYRKAIAPIGIKGAAQSQKDRDLSEAEAMMIVVRLASSTIGALHRMADALERIADQGSPGRQTLFGKTVEDARD